MMYCSLAILPSRNFNYIWESGTTRSYNFSYILVLCSIVYNFPFIRFFFTSIFINWKMVIIVEAIMNLAGVTVCERYSELDEFNLRKFQEKNCGNVEGIDGKVE